MYGNGNSMKTKTTFIFISLLGAYNEIQAPAKRLKGGRATVQVATELQENTHDQIILPSAAAAAFSELPSPRNSAAASSGLSSPKSSATALTQVQPEQAQVRDVDESLHPDENQPHDNNVESSAMPEELPLETHKASTAFAALRDLAGTPPENLNTLRERQELLEKQRLLQTLQDVDGPLIAIATLAQVNLH